MTSPHPAGKGTDRRAYNLAAWDAGHRRIFGSKKKAGGRRLPTKQPSLKEKTKCRK